MFIFVASICFLKFSVLSGFISYIGINQPLFIEVPVLSQEGLRSCIAVLGVSNLSHFTTFLFDFGTVPTVWYFSIRFWNCSDSVVFFY